MGLDYSSLQYSIEALEEALTSQAQLPDAASAGLRNTVRAGVIHRFEVCYEQCWKFMQRWLANNHLPDVESLSRTRRDLFRHAAHVGLIADAAPWFAYGLARNATAHTYRLQAAEDVAAIAPQFAKAARDLLTVLQAHID